MRSEVAGDADFAGIRYAQCWEDADVLLGGLDVRPGHVCLSIASAGDNTLSLLSRGAGRVVAVDFSPAQLACLELRVAAYRELAHGELLELIGSRPSCRRDALYRRLRGLLSAKARDFWDRRAQAVRGGVGAAGRFEGYFKVFRERVLPWVHPRRRVEELLRPKSGVERVRFYRRQWDTRAWRWMFGLFFSRPVMGRLGRDPRFFRYVHGGVAPRIRERVRYALTVLDPSLNPYLQWILTGRHGAALPHALRPENFDAIRANLHNLEWHCCSIEEFLGRERGLRIDRFNCSDLFEYVSEASCGDILERILAASAPGGRIAYWNLLVPRARPAHLSHALRPLPELARRLFRQDKAFFYSAFVLEEVVG